ncbi:MAG TPA: hypothetical protein VFR58_02825 [Flavisolibacter sp.]|nr:hypothetical protein [Flavisolibacter sp.]
MDMLTKAEEDFINYWASQRLKKKQFLRKMSFGLPLGVFVILALMINLFSGWYQRADMAFRGNSSVLIVVLVAGVAIVVFITIFSARHKWDQNELHYHELLRKKEQADPMQRL